MRRYRGHYDVTVMCWFLFGTKSAATTMLTRGGHYHSLRTREARTTRNAFTQITESADYLLHIRLILKSEWCLWMGLVPIWRQVRCNHHVIMTLGGHTMCKSQQLQK